MCSNAVRARRLGIGLATEKQATAIAEHEVSLSEDEDVKVSVGGANVRCCADQPQDKSIYKPPDPPKRGPCRRFGWLPNVNDGEEGEGVCSSTALCAWSPKAMWGYQTWARGKEICERQGARQCSIGQLIHGAAAGTGGGYDHWPVWSSTPCTTTEGDPGHWRYAFKTTPRPYVAAACDPSSETEAPNLIPSTIREGRGGDSDASCTTCMVLFAGPFVRR